MRLQFGTVNPSNVPLFVGGCSAEAACMANLDFIDVHFNASGQPWGVYVEDCIWARGFVTMFTADTNQRSDNVGEGIFVTLVSWR